MRYRKENGQWKEVTPIGASKEEVQELKDEIDTKDEKAVELTKAEYDALPDSKYTDGIKYIITDWSEASSGIKIIDNLESTSAIDALSANMGRELKQEIDDGSLPTLPKGQYIGTVMSASPVAGRYIGIIPAKNNGTYTISAFRTYKDENWGFIEIPISSCSIYYDAPTKSYMIECTDSRVAGKLIGMTLA